MNVVVFDFDDTLCPSRELCYDPELARVRLVDGCAYMEKVLEELDDESVLALEEAHKYAHVCILSNGTSSWVYGALALLPKTLDYCCRKDVQILTGPDLFAKTTECPMVMKKLGFEAICDPFHGNIRLLASIGDGLPEYHACLDYFHERSVPRCLAYRLTRMEPANMAGQVAMLRTIRGSFYHYIQNETRPYVEINVECRFDNKNKE